LKEISNDHKNQAPAETLQANYHHESDKLILEDDVQRIRLEGNVNVPEMITGVVGAVLGKSNCDREI
jgi:DNA polymerase delta subunit 2